MFFTQSLINALTLSAQYALLAAGFAMIYGISKIINFAHGAFFMWGGYLAFFLTSYAKVPYIIAIITSAVICFLVGMIINKTVIEFVAHDELSTMIVTLGLSMILVNAAEVIFGVQSVSYRSPFSGSLELGNIIIPTDRLFVIVAVSIVLVILFWALYRTKLGLALRTLATDKGVAAIHGINTKVMITVAFGIGAALAGLSGSILTSVFMLSPTVGESVMLMSFLVVILGGIGNIVGGVVAAFGVGILQSFITSYVGGNWSNVSLFMLVIIFLLWRPNGILGAATKRE
jgi:branched-chain amino acid transport system permease protein